MGGINRGRVLSIEIQRHLLVPPRTNAPTESAIGLAMCKYFLNLKIVGFTLMKIQQSGVFMGKPFSKPPQFAGFIFASPVCHFPMRSSTVNWGSPDEDKTIS